jgi:4a-hydroxytetrahydrobiopterin dehydratase
MTSSIQPVFASSYDPAVGAKDLEGILRDGGKGGRWTLVASGRGVERSFRFKGFKKTWVGCSPLT